MLSKTAPIGGNFEILGIDFDGELLMADEIRKLVSKCSWKAKLMLRSHRCHSDAHMMGLFKTKVLNYIEYRTAAISHAARSALRPLGAVLSDFLKQINMTELDALRNFNLAPLQVRRGIAMLGMIHRSQGLKAIPQLKAILKVDANAWHLHESMADTEVTRRSAFGLVPVYRALPAEIRSITQVSAFQARIQRAVLKCAEAGGEWRTMLSPETWGPGV